jgi:serine/threonine protein kinase
MAGVMSPTPAPTDCVPGLYFETGTVTLDPPEVAASPGDQDTDSHFANRSLDTDVHPPLAKAPSKSLSKSNPKAPPDLTLPLVPGYEIERVIGRGGMGTVFLARQLSLDRPVALKLMARKWADDPTFVARFTREAYAAARLNHPNLVQVYDIGEVNGQRFFSMEFVEGRSLADVVRAAGRLDPEAAVGYILQAARGLKHAHDRGMIHRDIKPDNLLLDPQGLVKVADLGLVKTPGLNREDDSTAIDDDNPKGLKAIPGDMTGARMALGTPAYMSPEQCRDAAAVDHRADIYSLGCTLYALVTGRQPFDGDTAVELMTKHAYTPLVPPEEIAARVPRELSAIIQKMMAKPPNERHQTMGEVIRVLEQWLGIHHSASSRLAASEEQIAALEVCVDQFNYAPTALVRAKLLTGFFSACLLAAVVLTFVGRLGWAFGLAGLIVQATLVYFPLNGAARKTYLFRRVRQLVAGSSVGDWLVAFAMLVLFAILLWMLKLFWMWVGFGMIGAALACALRFGLDRTIEAERHTAIAGCERLLRRLRVQGFDEDQLRFFVAKYAGRHWEEFFEALFGYEAKLDARARLMRGESAGHRERFAGWREPLIAIIDRIDRARRARLERIMLMKVEEERLLAGGMTAAAARHRAERTADVLLRQVAAFRTAESKRRALALSTLAPRLSGTSKELPNLQKLLDDVPAESATPVDPIRRCLGWLVGPVVRGTLAILCLLTCLLWTWQNNVLASPDEAAGITNHGLVLPNVPAEYTEWVDSANVGMAGILLITSLFYTGQRMGLLVLVGAVVAIVAHRFGIPAVEPIRDHHVGLMLGTMIALLGYRFGRR